jgi:ribosomal-protein-alanine N-acetyltransferase
VDFVLRLYRAADFDRLWQIDQACFPAGIAYSQMELSGFITRRNAITIVAEFADAESREEIPTPENATAGNAAESKQNANVAKRAPQHTNERDEKRIAAFAVVQPYRKTGRILTLDVLPEARRYGLGSTLMRECEEHLRKRGCTEVYLETAVDNEAALKLYHKLGYQILRTLPAYYHAHGLDAFLMGKVL